MGLTTEARGIVNTQPYNYSACLPKQLNPFGGLYFKANNFPVKRNTDYKQPKIIPYSESTTKLNAPPNSKQLEPIEDPNKKTASPVLPKKESFFSGFNFPNLIDIFKTIWNSFLSRNKILPTITATISKNLVSSTEKDSTPINKSNSINSNSSGVTLPTTEKDEPPLVNKHQVTQENMQKSTFSSFTPMEDNPYEFSGHNLVNRVHIYRTKHHILRTYYVMKILSETRGCEFFENVFREKEELGLL